MLNRHATFFSSSGAPGFNDLTADHLAFKLAETEEEIIAAQKLRYDVFYHELGAHPTDEMATLERDFDRYDPLCDHLLVVDRNAPKDRQIIGTYRALLLEKAQEQNVPLYCETEFDFSKLKQQSGRIMEVSRSCIHPDYRNKMALNLLWRGIAAYVTALNVDYLIGMPSLPGVEIEPNKDALAYLQAFHLAPDDIRPYTLDRMAPSVPLIDKDSINAKRAFMALPPLLKGYLRLGALVGDGLFIDRQFNCIDIAIIVKMKDVADRYLNYYLSAS